eukprot:m.167199 g.167199  ORF g.167199 m.167199 type:complete len:79 (-) comp53158_c0_seq9:192-428(-)
MITRVHFPPGLIDRQTEYNPGLTGNSRMHRVSFLSEKPVLNISRAARNPDHPDPSPVAALPVAAAVTVVWDLQQLPPA